MISSGKLYWIMAKKFLYKSDTDKKLDGVCAGIAEYFDVDPTLIRVGYVFIDVITGVVPGLLAYLVLSLVMPRKAEVKA
jgi:phage shock protein C